MQADIIGKIQNDMIHMVLYLISSYDATGLGRLMLNTMHNNNKTVDKQRGSVEMSGNKRLDITRLY